jgi:hypothetical protein
MTYGKALLATTALVLCVSVAYAGRETGRPSDRIVPRFMKQGAPGVDVHGVPVTVLTGRKFTNPAHADDPLYEPGVTFSNLSKDKNAEYISWYGFTAIDSEYSYYQSSHYHYKVSEVGFNAAPFTGAGRRVKKIGAPIYGSESVLEFDLGIYSATVSGLPGNEIAGGSAIANDGGLAWVTVNIFLDAGQKYFFAVRCGENKSSCEGGWNLENTNFTGGAVDYWHYKIRETDGCTGSGCSSPTYSYSSPWHESTEIPATGAFVIK